MPRRAENRPLHRLEHRLDRPAKFCKKLCRLSNTMRARIANTCADFGLRANFYELTGILRVATIGVNPA